MIGNLLDGQSVIITLDMDNSILDRIHAIAEAGFSLVEVNCTNPDKLHQLIQHYPKLHFGAGNIINTEQLEACYSAGVTFATSPGFSPSIAQTASIYSMNYLPGIATVSEAMQVMALGYSFVRPYPAILSFCTLLNRCLPNLRLVPADIECEEAEHFLNLPAVSAVSIHNPLKKQLQTLSVLLNTVIE